MPWEIGKADVSYWVDNQRTQGLSPETIQQRLAALSSFYAYAIRTYTQITPSGQEQPLHPQATVAGLLSQGFLACAATLNSLDFEPL